MDALHDEAQERIAELMFEYRQFKVTADMMAGDMKAVKRELQPLLEQHGKWEDDDGYAMIVHRNPSVSYKSSAVEKLVTAWLKSDNPVLNSAGEMLAAHRQEKDGYSYVRVS